ncbi:MAG TPA: hypothetical protein VFS35_09910, partial [Terrimicrobiaceae bacterium]|nr:hypothetical protein [Terrimicrobiaceae bacterium]
GTDTDNVDLGTLGGANSTANAINDLGQIVGSSGAPSPAVGSRATLFRTTGNNVDLGGLGDDTTSRANDINNLGQIVGEAEIQSNNTPATIVTRATLFSGTGTGNIDLGDSFLTGVPSSAAAINNVGQIVGYRENGSRRAAVFSPGGSITELGTLPGGNFSQATAINDAGLIVGVGNALPPRLEYHGAIFQGFNNNVDLGVLPEHSGTGAGRDGFSRASDVNNAGMIVGYSQLSGINIPTNGSGVIGTGSGWVRLPIDMEPAAINDWGQIVGTYRNRATLLNPVDPSDDDKRRSDQHQVRWRNGLWTLCRS